MMGGDVPSRAYAFLTDLEDSEVGVLAQNLVDLYWAWMDQVTMPDWPLDSRVVEELLDALSPLEELKGQLELYDDHYSFRRKRRDMLHYVLVKLLRYSDEARDHLASISFTLEWVR